VVDVAIGIGDSTERASGIAPSWAAGDGVITGSSSFEVTGVDSSGVTNVRLSGVVLPGPVSLGGMLSEFMSSKVVSSRSSGVVLAGSWGVMLAGLLWVVLLDVASTGLVVLGITLTGAAPLGVMSSVVVLGTGVKELWEKPSRRRFSF